MTSQLPHASWPLQFQKLNFNSLHVIDAWNMFHLWDDVWGGTMRYVKAFILVWCRTEVVTYNLHICQGWDDPYVPRTHEGLLKWKYAHMNSIDFLFEVVLSIMLCFQLCYAFVFSVFFSPSLFLGLKFLLLLSFSYMNLSVWTDGWWWSSTTFSLWTREEKTDGRK